MSNQIDDEKTYMTTEQFIEAWKSLKDDKRKELLDARDAAWDTAWYAARLTAWDTACITDWDAAWNIAWLTAWDTAWNIARKANLAVLVRDKITAEQFEILTRPWTSCQLSLFAEDWQRLQQSEVV